MRVRFWFSLEIPRELMPSPPALFLKGEGAIRTA